MHRDVSDMHDEVHVEIAEIKRELTELYRRVEQADNGINENLNYKYGLLDSSVGSVATSLDAHDTHMKMFAWENYRKDGESLEDAKKRFFRTLPKATGGMRLLQLGCAKLLGEFDALCREHSLSYWMMFGTLLGAIRNEGFIPWDDDVDLAMPRDDIERLMELIEDDDRYVVTVVYDEWAHCRQVRFRYSEQEIPCFLDLFYFDWTNRLDDAPAAQMRSQRVKMIEKMKADEELEFWRADQHYLRANDDRAVMVSHYFDDALSAAREAGLICDREDTTGIVWSLDNITSVQKRQTYPLEDVYETLAMRFEGVKLMAPANYDLFLRSPYGDYLELPNDIKSHFEHVSHDELEYGDSNDELRRLVGTEVRSEEQ